MMLVDDFNVKPDVANNVSSDHYLLHITIYAWAWLIQHNFQPIHGAAAKGHLNILQLLVDVYDVDPTATTEVY